MFFGKLINILKKESHGETLGKQATIVQLCETRDNRFKYFAIKIGDSFGCNKKGEPITSRNYRQIQKIASTYNRNLQHANKRH